MRELTQATLLFVLPLAAMGACVSDDSAPPAPSDDAGAVDDASGDSGEGSEDAGARDASVADSSVADAGPGDADVADSSVADAYVSDANEAGAGDAGTGAIRVGNLSPDGVAIDFCIAPGGSPFSGTPHMTAAGVAAGLAYASVSELTGGFGLSTYGVRIVAAGATTCATALAGVSDLTVPGPTSGHPVTVALLGISGNGTSPLTLRAFTDDDGASAPTTGLRVRFVHAAPLEPATDFEIGAGQKWVYPLQTAIAYGQASAPGTTVSGAPVPDAQGYLTSPIDSAQLTAKSGGTDRASGYDTEYRSGSVFFVGNAASATSPLGMLVCDDTSPAVAHRSACTLRTGAPTYHQLRFLNLAPDSAPVDACLSLAPLNPYVGVSVAGGVAGGIAFKKLTGPLATYPDWTALSAQFVPQGTPCTSTSIGGSIGTSLASVDDTVVLVQTAFAPNPSFYLTVAYYDWPDPNVGANASVSFSNDGVVTGAETVDAFDTPKAGVEESLAPNVGPRNSAGFAQRSPGTYAFRAADHTTTTLATMAGASLLAGASSSLHFFDLTATTRGLALCDDADPGVGQLTTCSP